VRGSAIAAAGLSLGLALALMPASAPAGPQPKVRVRATGKNSERLNTIPITKDPGDAERVVMSMSPERLPSLADGDRLEGSAELQVTVDCLKRSPRCAGPIYRWNPAVHMKLVLGPSVHSRSGPDSVTLGRERVNCLQELPNREHHCMLVIQKAPLDIDSTELPCALDACYLNVVASADNPEATGREKLIIGANRPDGTIHQDKGRINAIRFHPGPGPDVPVLRTSKRRDTRLPLNEDVATVVYSKRLDGLDKGEQLAVTGLLRSQVAHLPYNARTAVHVILAHAPRATHPNDLVDRVSTQDGEITENNGINCTQKQTPCDSPKVGVIELRHDARNPHGERVPLFVNLVAIYAAKRQEARPGDRVKVLRGGGLRIRRFPAELRG
jgi:hypothetical protein